MINKELLNPSEIVVVGGSTNLRTIGGATLKNLKDTYSGIIYVVNPQETGTVQECKSFHSIHDIPSVECAILCIPSNECPDAVDELVNIKGCKAIIILSGGFRESGPEGALAEDKIKTICEKSEVSLFGPNSTGLITPVYAGTFRKPIPELHPNGAILISASGSTIVYILETAQHLGLPVKSVFSVGNSAQNGVEDILQYIDINCSEKNAPTVLMLYIESIAHPDILLKHSSSLISKGAKICAIKAGTSDSGSKAASLHTGAIASSDKAVNALFHKAGIVRCFSRTELVFVASAMMLPELKGKRIAVITSAGGPAILQTDFFSASGMEIPKIEGSAADALLTKLNTGSSVSNPIDIMTDGTADQLAEVIDFCQNDCPQIDAMTVIWGGLEAGGNEDVYDVLLSKLKTCTKPIYIVMASTLITSDRTTSFHQKGAITFPDEVFLAKALKKISESHNFQSENISLPPVDRHRIREVINNNGSGHLQPEQVQILLDAAGIPRVKEASAYSVDEALEAVREIGGYPLVMKVVGPEHNYLSSGTTLNVREDLIMKNEFERMMKIPGADCVLFQKMLSGIEIFIGAKKEGNFGHLVMCGMGGVFVETLNDISIGLAPFSKEEVDSMIKSLKAYPILRGLSRGNGINLNLLNETIRRVSALCLAAPEIEEFDINPMLGDRDSLMSVNARITLKK
ncbi:MAG: acetate--CoA ligase family protein [Alistipes sp.]|nr:acetate--CoA ligase family protein [Candidatus Minthomonas equi]